MLRSLAIALVLARLALSDLAPTASYAAGSLPLVCMTLGALAIAFEPRRRVRRLFLALVGVGYAAWIVHDDLGWHGDAFHLELAGWTLLEAAVVACFTETWLWRRSIVAAVPLLGWLAYYLFPRYAAPVIDERIAWLGQALALLVANAGLRAIREEDARYEGRGLERLDGES